MKQLTKILLYLALLLAFHVGTANSNETEGGKSSEKDNQQQQTGQKESERLDEEPVSENVNPDDEVVTDSVEDDSVSKYNFIFYFYYKYKYDQTEEL